MAKNKAYSIDRTGGILGALAGREQKTLQKLFDKINKNGEEVVFVINNSHNIIETLVAAMILLLTLGLYTKMPGYVIIAKASEQGINQ